MTQDTTPTRLLLTCSQCKREVDISQEQVAIPFDPDPRGSVFCMGCYEGPDQNDPLRSPSLNRAMRERMSADETRRYNDSWIRAYWRTK
jgi:hypothetical protein